MKYIKNIVLYGTKKTGFKPVFSYAKFKTKSKPKIKNNTMRTSPQDFFFFIFSKNINNFTQ